MRVKSGLKYFLGTLPLRSLFSSPEQVDYQGEGDQQGRHQDVEQVHGVRQALLLRPYGRLWRNQGMCNLDIISYVYIISASNIGDRLQ